MPIRYLICDGPGLMASAEEWRAWIAELRTLDQTCDNVRSEIEFAERVIADLEAEAAARS